jgi:hypothetical protein
LNRAFPNSSFIESLSLYKVTRRKTALKPNYPLNQGPDKKLLTCIAKREDPNVSESSVDVSSFELDEELTNHVTMYHRTIDFDTGS